MKLRNLLLQHGVVTLYQRFESVAAIAMMVLVTLMISVAVVRLTYTVINGLLLGALNPLDHKIFQGVFGDLVTILIALEFNHSLQYVVSGKKSIIQTRLILLIALLAVARKFIVLDIEGTTPGVMLGLSSIALVVGIVYWLLRGYDDHAASMQPPRFSENPRRDEDV